MAYTDFIAAIDLGTSHLVGMVGTKGSNGALSIIAYEVENSDACIRRGCVYNIKEAASKINRLILKLENKLNGSKIDKVYIGIGGQSLRTINHSVSRIIGESNVTQEILDKMDEECKSYHPDMLEVYSISSPVFYLDNKPELNPLGLTCSRLEARYKLIVGRPSLKSVLTNSLSQHVRSAIAGTPVAPLALSELLLSENEKMQGCALVNFGAGVTSVTIYKQGKLHGLTVIPLGSQLITRDLMALNIQEKEAERVKRSFGNAIWDKDEDQQLITLDMPEGFHTREVKLSEINIIVEARIREIIENVYARLEEAGVAKEPGFSVIISGNGAALRNLREAIAERFKMEVRYASVRKDKIESGEMLANNADYTTAVALLLAGDVNCALKEEMPEPQIVKAESTEPTVVPVVEEPKEVLSEPKIEPSPESKPHKEPTKPSSKQESGKGKKSVFGILDLWAEKMNDIIKEE